MGASSWLAAIASTGVAHAQADGHTLMAGGNGNLAINLKTAVGGCRIRQIPFLFK